LTCTRYVPGVKYGFDFIEQKACTSYSDYPGCHSHIFFTPFEDINLHYDIRVDFGYAVKAGKTNLDSLKTAPADTIFQKSPGRADSIPPDSLASRVGNCYWIHTGTDPDLGWSLYAKIKILDFKVLDSAARKVEMRFLYACNNQGVKNLTTSGLDTFHLNTPVITSHASSPAVNRPSGQRVFKVVGDRFVVPGELLSAGAWLGVYDLRGRRLGIADIKGKNILDLSKFKCNKQKLLILKAQ
jgi:hypothetical protein